MAIISESNANKGRRYGNTQFRYALIYVLVTFVVLLFLNFYCSRTSQQLFYRSKESSMLDKCRIAAEDISELEVLSTTSVAEEVAKMTSLKMTRLVVTDHAGAVIFDSAYGNSTIGDYVLFPEVVQALRGNDVFTWNYHEGVMTSRTAIPVYTNAKLSGCLYMMEYDSDQGALLWSLQRNILTITLVLEIAVIIYSITFAIVFSNRLRRIRASMRDIRNGDYSQQVDMGGHDELTLLGAEFNDLTQRLRESERKRHQFVSDASHELKTPLASIKLLSDSILQNDMDMATIKEFVADIGNEADRLNRMTQKLLSLTRIETQEDGDCEITYMAPTIERVVKMLSGIATATGIEINLELSNDAPILILEDDLYQITFNLVENGIKYNIPGGKLTIHLERDEENAYLHVSDTGVGIPEESLPHIFERFYRVDKARARKSGGSGLGLSIVRNMVERNSGTIQVDSTPGSGSTFTVSFPIFDTEEEPR